VKAKMQVQEHGHDVGNENNQLTNNVKTQRKKVFKTLQPILCRNKLINSGQVFLVFLHVTELNPQRPSKSKHRYLIILTHAAINNLCQNNRVARRTTC